MSLTRGERSEIVPNMVLCLERAVSNDGYLGDMVQETVLAVATGAVKPTNAPMRYW